MENHTLHSEFYVKEELPHFSLLSTMSVAYLTLRIARYVSISLSLSAILAVSLLLGTLWSTMWNGYYVLLGWLALQCFLAEITYKYFHYNYGDTDVLDVILAIIITLVVCVATASLGVDLIAENAHSKVYVVNNLFNSDVCNQVISIAETHAAEYGWLTKRHKNYPTTDLAVHTIKQNISISEVNRLHSVKRVDFSLWVNGTILKEIFPRLMSYYSLSSIDLMSMQDLFIVKYDGVTPGAQRHLQMHMDSSLLSFNIALSDHAGGPGATSFEGGGTHFSLSDDVIQLERGAMLAHPSRIYHEGVAVTGGVRYIMVGFVKVDQWRWNTVWRRFGGFTKCLSVFHQQQQQHQKLDSDPPFQLASTVCQPWLYTYYFSVSSLVLDIVNHNNDNSESVLMKCLLLLIVVALVSLGVICVSLCWEKHDSLPYHVNEEFDDSRYEVVYSKRPNDSSGNSSCTGASSSSIIGLFNSKVSSKQV